MAAGMPYARGGRARSKGGHPGPGDQIDPAPELAPEPAPGNWGNWGSRGSPLEAALGREDFEFASRCLLAGLARAVEKLPAGSLEGMLDVITGRNDGPEARRRKTAKKSL